MSSKQIIRKKYFLIRKKRYFEITGKFFFPLVKILKFKFKKQFLKIALYYPSNFELNVLKFLENPYMKNKNILLTNRGIDNIERIFQKQVF